MRRIGVLVMCSVVVLTIMTWLATAQQMPPRQNESGSVPTRLRGGTQQPPPATAPPASAPPATAQPATSPPVATPAPSPSPAHSNGIRQYYGYNAPLDIPGNETTYSAQMALAAAYAWRPSGASSPRVGPCSGAGAVFNSGNFPPTCAVWAFSGPAAGT
jgi:hypothetical protein